MARKALLAILDGWGIGEHPESDAIRQANTPYVDELLATQPNSTLVTFGNDVGLPDGQMGNSEVGHLNIGAGRIVYQELARVNKAIAENTLSENERIIGIIDYARTNEKPVHLMGLLSDGGVHSHIRHLLALIDIFDANGIRCYVHAFLDGRDTDPNGGAGYLTDLQNHIKGKTASIATIVGRYYAMDRDNRWERIKIAYDALVHGTGTSTDDVVASIQEGYAQGTTDEFMTPIIADDSGLITAGDACLFFNFRTDRPRQITTALTQRDFPEYEMEPLQLHFVTMTNYDASYSGVHVVYDKDAIPMTIGEVIQNAGLTQVRIAETEKYPHVTFFLNGGREEEFVEEERILIPSPKVATYDLAPEMSAIPLTDAICQKIDANPPDFICLNYANADMVGHTGDFNAAQRACETVDQCLRRLVTKALEYDYEIIIIADHGNSDYMINADGSPNTSHTTNLVPMIYISPDEQHVEVRSGKLGDIAPTILSLMGVDIPSEMTGEVLIER
ncbi:MAG: 2,3-bisphosphoglycerate-independent phosphoglycerate mutase [Bacteroidota bacterium]